MTAKFAGCNCVPVPAAFLLPFYANFCLFSTSQLPFDVLNFQSKVCKRSSKRAVEMKRKLHISLHFHCKYLQCTYFKNEEKSVLFFSLILMPSDFQNVKKPSLTPDGYNRLSLFTIPKISYLKQFQLKAYHCSQKTKFTIIPLFSM